MNNEIVNLISNLGFPIACVLALAYYIWKTNTTITETNKDREDKMFKQLQDFNITLNNFNATLNKIDNRLEVLENKIK